MIKIPFDPSLSAHQQFQVLISEQLVATITLKWNTRSEAWYLSVATQSGSIEGLKVVQKFPLLREHRALSPIAGDLIVLPTTHPAPDPITYDSLGNEWGLFWVSDDEVRKWEVANGLG